MAERLIAIGDIHGCIHTLKGLLKTISYSSTTDTLVFVGDYIDRGRFSYEVVEFVKKLQHEVGKEKCVCLRGNHEQMAIEARNAGYDSIWISNGGGATLQSYEENQVDPLNHISWFETLPVIYDTPEIIFCHAGLSKPNLEDNKLDDFLWGRDWIERDIEPREKQVVFGHTPRQDGHAYVTNTGDICIDTACVFGGNLCALVIEESGNSECFYEKRHQEDAWE